MKDIGLQQPYMLHPTEFEAINMATLQQGDTGRLIIGVFNSEAFQSVTGSKIRINLGGGLTVKKVENPYYTFTTSGGIVSGVQVKEFAPDANIEISIEVVATGEGEGLVEAEISSDNDPVSGNNRSGSYYTITAKPKQKATTAFDYLVSQKLITKAEQLRIKKRIDKLK